MRRRTGKRTKRGLTTATLSEQQHATYRGLLRRTGLKQSIFMDRLLQLGERRIFEIISPETPIPEAVPA